MNRRLLLQDISRKVGTYGRATLSRDVLKAQIGPRDSLLKAAEEFVANTPYRAEQSEEDGICDRVLIVPKETEA
tara:strand:- start:252 stop:473 length:222 start_codon:yes stop_codon:yes gene_type:complete